MDIIRQVAITKLLCFVRENYSYLCFLPKFPFTSTDTDSEVCVGVNFVSKSVLQSS